jgi:hypothetical protein
MKNLIHEFMEFNLYISYTVYIKLKIFEFPVKFSKQWVLHKINNMHMLL